AGFIKAKSIQFGLAYEVEPPTDTIENGISKLEDFYAIAIKRDKSLVENTIEGMTKAGQNIAVLVTGGFHSEGMARLLEERGVSYVVVCPNITKDVPTPYIQVLTNQRASFEDILVGAQEPVKQNMLAPALISWAIKLKPRELRQLVKIYATELKGRISGAQTEWIRKHLSLWFRKAAHYMGQHRMAHDKDVLKEAYKMAMERTLLSVGTSSAEEAKFVADDIMSTKIFITAFDAVYDSVISAPAVVRITQDGLMTTGYASELRAQQLSKTPPIPISLNALVGNSVPWDDLQKNFSWSEYDKMYAIEMHRKILEVVSAAEGKTGSSASMSSFDATAPLKIVIDKAAITGLLAETPMTKDRGNFILAAELDDDQKSKYLGAVSYSSVKGWDYLEKAKSAFVIIDSLDGGIGANVGRELFKKWLVEEKLLKEPGLGAKGTDFGFILDDRGHREYVTIAEAKLMQIVLMKRNFQGMLFEPIVNKDSKKSYESLLDSICLEDRIKDTSNPRRYRDLLDEEKIEVTLPFKSAPDYPGFDEKTGSYVEGVDVPSAHGNHGNSMFGMLYQAFEKKSGTDANPHFRVFLNGENLNSRANKYIIGAMVAKGWPIIKIVTRAEPIDEKGGKDGLRVVKDSSGKIILVPDQMEVKDAMNAGQLPSFYAAGKGQGENQPFNTNIFIINITVLHDILKELVDQKITTPDGLKQIISPALIENIKENTSSDKFRMIEGAAGTAVHNLNAFFMTNEKARDLLEKRLGKEARMLHFVNVPRSELFTPIKKTYDPWFQFFSGYYDVPKTGQEFMDMEYAITPKTNNPPPEFDLSSKDVSGKDDYWTDLLHYKNSLGMDADVTGLTSLKVRGKVKLLDAKLIGDISIINTTGQEVDLAQLMPGFNGTTGKTTLKNTSIIIFKDSKGAVRAEEKPLVVKLATTTSTEAQGTSQSDIATSGSAVTTTLAFNEGDNVNFSEWTQEAPNLFYQGDKKAKKAIATVNNDGDFVVSVIGTQGAITVTGVALTPAQKTEVNGKIRADFESGNAKFISKKAGAVIYEIPSLEGLTYLVAHPGRGGDLFDHLNRRIYMSPSRLNWYNNLDSAARQQFLQHEIMHLDNPGMTEAEVTEKAPIGLVLAAIIQEDINTKMGNVALRDVLDNPDRGFEISIPEIIKLYGSNVKWAIDRMSKSTAGTRGILDKDDILGGPQLNAAVITFMAQGYADYINANFQPDERGAFIGFDPRYFSKEFAWLFTRVLLANGIKVYRDTNEQHTQTPVTSYMAYYLKIACGIEVTSSHNPPNQNGIKSMTWYGGVDTDDVSAKIAAHIQRMYDQGITGKGVVKIARYDTSKIMIVDAKKLYYDAYMSRLFNEKTITMMKTAMDGGAKFVFDGLYGVGGPSMEYYLDRVFAGYNWRGKIIIMNATPDSSIGGIERPDPSNPKTLEVSGVLEKLASTPGVLIAVTADMDADRIGTAVIIPEKDVARAKRYGLFVSQMEFAGNVVNIVRFTPNQIFTLISYERVLQAYEKKIGTRQFDEIKRAIAEGRAPELYLLTSIPSSLLAKQMIETFGGKVVLTTVGFKNLGYEAEKLDRERPDAVVISLMEESGGSNIGPFTKDSRGSGIHRDKDTIALALALFASASELKLENKNMLDLYADMAEKLGGLYYYERIDAYLPNQAQAESLLETDQKNADAVKNAVIGRYRAIDNVKEPGAAKSNLDDPKNIAILAELFGKRSEDITGVEETPVANTVLLIGEGNDWQHVQPIAKRFTFKDGEIIEVFHTGRDDQEGPSIAIYDATGKFKARALLRASGTESMIRAYLEIFEPQSNPHPENLYKYFTPLLRYLGLQNYSIKAQGRDYLSEYIDTVNAKYGVSEKRLVSGSAVFEVEKAGAIKIGQKLHTPLDAKGDKARAAGFLKGGYNKDGKTANIGYGVEEKASIDGSFAIAGEGNQGYFVDEGRQFLTTVKDMRDFFARRAQILGKPIKYVIKPGIGGQHTPFQGIAEVFQVVDTETGVVVGEYELGKNYEEAIGKVLAANGADWDQIAVVPSSKSGSTDETMMIFSEVFYTLLKKIAERDGLAGEKFAETVFNTLHDINFVNGAERKSADLFKGFNLALLTDNLNAIPGFKTDYRQVRSIFRVVLGNMFFETTNRPEQSRLSAFIQNSGLGKELGEEYAPGFGAMFDNVGGRWTADLHMMTFLAYHGMTDAEIQAYWQSRYDGINEVRAGTHFANAMANKTLDEEITDIALVVPDELFWFGKAMEQNRNESTWQDGFANLVAVKASMWTYQKPNYANKPNRLVIDMTVSGLDMKGCDVFSVPPPYKTASEISKDKLAIEIGKLFTTFYGATYVIGTRLITRALAREGYTWADVDINDLENPATRIVQRNLFLRQPYVELGKGLLEEKLGDLQKSGPAAIQEELAKIQDEARQGKLISNIKGLGLPDTVTDMQALAQTIASLIRLADEEGRKFVPFIYLEGEKYYELRDHLISLGIEWVMQGTGDQHISYQQVLTQPKKFLPFIISFIPPKESLIQGRPAIGFSKGYLNNVSPNMVRDLFAQASYKALTEPRKDEVGKDVKGALGAFLRIQDTRESRAMFTQSFDEAVRIPTKAPVVGAAQPPASGASAEEKPVEGVTRDQYIHDTYVKEDAAALRQTLVGLGIDTDRMKKKVLILYDTAIDPDLDTVQVARAGEVAVNKYMSGTVTEVRGTG
ncbi:MAG: hypothetical protein KKH77_07125, partial [Candidatus Omnitrophica bacterium]|nr:hypothetical protein [Candidatus Omnitrophota bacterium]